MRSPLVTVVTPSFNQGHFIRATIESVLEQDYPHVEYIVMDGGSTDQTEAVAREYGSRLKFFSEKDRGQSHAINKGFHMARGEVVSWLNSDDTILPGAISRAVAAFESDPDAGAVYGEGYLLDYDGNVTGRFPVTEPFNLWKLVHLSDYILQQTVYFRRDVLAELGWLNESLHYIMDWELLIRIGKQYRLKYIPEYLGCLREYAAAKTFAGGPERVAEIGRVLRKETNMFLPPGYVVYGLDTYSSLWYQAIDRASPAFLRGPAERLKLWLARTVARMIGDRVQGAQGWYADGWATSEASFMLPPGRGSISIRGQLPDWARWLEGQFLRVELNGGFVAELPVPFGDFEFHLPLGTRRTGEPLQIRLHATKYFVPFAERQVADQRRLCYILKSLTWK